MEFLSSFLVSSAIALLAQTGAPPNTPGTSKLDFRIDRVLTVDNSAFDQAIELQFDLYLRRPDLGLKENKQRKFGKHKYTADLPLPLQPKLMYVSDINDHDPESGRMCDRPRFPHRCIVDVTIPEKGAKPVYKYLIKVTFEDDSYSEKEIDVPFIGFLEKPKILGPAALPNQGDRYSIKFKDVGAKAYEVYVNFCKPYGNDGINPCDDGIMYYVERRLGKLVARRYEGLPKPTLTVKDGIVELKSDFPLAFETSVQYRIKASKWNTGTYFESNDYKTFDR